MPHTQINTYFTKPAGLVRDKPTQLLYSAEEWVRIELQLETAGPVAVGTSQNLAPVGGGQGVLIPSSGEPIKFILPRGDRLYIIAETVNRVKFIVEPLPWIEQILQSVGSVASGIGQLSQIMRAIGNRRKPEPEPPKPPCPPNFGRR